MCAQCFTENQYFCGHCKKIKKMSREIPYFSTMICPFYTCITKKWFLLKLLCEHVGCGDIHATSYFEFFWYSQICLKCIQKREHMHSSTWKPKHHVHSRANINTTLSVFIYKSISPGDPKKVSVAAPERRYGLRRQ
jgi:C4-type Zn-finger protein